MKKHVHIILFLLIFILSGCGQEAPNAETVQRVPVETQWREEDYPYYNAATNTIYEKDYYAECYGAIRPMTIRECEINIQEELEDYFELVNPNVVEGLRPLADMFYDNRTIEMDAEELKQLFYSQGYYLYLHDAEGKGFHVRLVEIQVIEEFSLYPNCVLIQTWDDEHIYVEEITAPIPRKIESFLLIDDREELQMVIHSTGVSVDYVTEEELSFWKFRGSYWILAPLELEIDSGKAYYLDKTDLHGLYYEVFEGEESEAVYTFPEKYYSDGITYRPSRQEYGRKNIDTLRLGHLEEVEKNRVFRLYAVGDNFGHVSVSSTRYIEYTILPEDDAESNGMN